MFFKQKKVKDNIRRVLTLNQDFEKKNKNFYYENLKNNYHNYLPLLL